MVYTRCFLAMHGRPLECFDTVQSIAAAYPFSHLCVQLCDTDTILDVMNDADAQYLLDWYRLNGTPKFSYLAEVKDGKAEYSEPFPDCFTIFGSADGGDEEEIDYCGNGYTFDYNEYVYMVKLFKGENPNEGKWER